MTSELMTRISVWAAGRKSLLKLMTTSHILSYRLSQGTVGGLIAGVPNLLLTTVGRKSGRRYTTPLFFLNHKKAFAVVASFGGSPTDPQWWKNMKHSGHAWVQVGPKRFEVRPEEVGPELKQELWEAFCQFYPGYNTYQQRTERVIPIILLHPV